MLCIYAMNFCTDVIASTAFVRFPELAHVVSMPATIEVAVCIIGACLLAVGVVGIDFFADSFYVFASAPVCRASQRVENCIQMV